MEPYQKQEGDPDAVLEDSPRGLEPYAPPPEATDQTIRVLEIPRVRAWSYAGLSPSSVTGLRARNAIFGADSPALYEPDHVRWPGKDGMERALLRGGLGHWGGYVLVPEGHVLYDATIPLEALDVHGGVSFRRHGMTPTGSRVRVLGFDTLHAEDLLHGLPYRDVWFAATELMKLANQLGVMTRRAHEVAAGASP